MAFRLLMGAVMGKHLHLFRRGNVFYWRRRISGLSTENGMIRLSLRTGVRREAYIVARKLTAESDRMFGALSRNLLFVKDGRTWLSHVISEQLVSVRRVALVTKMDLVGSPESDRWADWAAAQAWKLLAEFGPRAQLSEVARERLDCGGASEHGLSSLESCLEQALAGPPDVGSDIAVGDNRSGDLWLNMRHVEAQWVDRNDLIWRRISGCYALMGFDAQIGRGSLRDFKVTVRSHEQTHTPNLPQGNRV